MPTSRPGSHCDRAFCISDTEQAAMDRNPHERHHRIVEALAMARKYRHHPDCHCRRYQRTACSAAAALWENALNRELEKIRAHHDPSPPGPYRASHHDCPH